MRIFAALLAILAVLTAAPEVRAQVGSSYITPFPEGDLYKVQVYGDAFADGIIPGLIESLADDTRVQVQRKHRHLVGIARQEFEDDIRVEEISRDAVHIGVVMVGLNDRYHIRTTGRDRILLGTPEWREEYGKRVDRLIKALKNRNVAIYWVGLPLMRRPEINDPVQTMNDIVREKAYLNGIKYIDIIQHFADEAGNYAPVGPDISGRPRQMRDYEGILFTGSGYRKLAHFVEREIKRDLTLARGERSIPLAGAEAEQRRIVPQRPRPSTDQEWKGTVTSAKRAQRRTAAPAGPDPRGEQKADNSRIALRIMGASGREETVTLDLPRPAIPAAIVQLITRKDTGERPSQMGDVLADDVGNGLVVLSSVTPVTTNPGLPRRASPDQPFYQVWIKGERLPPRPGRSDDFTWPRPDPEISVGPVPRRSIRPRAAAGN